MKARIGSFYVPWLNSSYYSDTDLLNIIQRSYDAGSRLRELHNGSYCDLHLSLIEISHSSRTLERMAFNYIVNGDSNHLEQAFCIRLRNHAQYTSNPLEALAGVRTHCLPFREVRRLAWQIARPFFILGLGTYGFIADIVRREHHSLQSANELLQPTSQEKNDCIGNITLPFPTPTFTNVFYTHMVTHLYPHLQLRFYRSKTLRAAALDTPDILADE